MRNLLQRIVSRYLKTAMAVVLRDVVHHNWGWFSREDARMHLQTVDRDALVGSAQVKVWLEDKGRRTFKFANGTLTGRDAKKLQETVDLHRRTIETQWVHFMLQQDWLRASLQDSVVTLTAYPQTHHKFQRQVDLRKLFPGAYKGLRSWDEVPPLVDFDMENGLLAVGRQSNLDARNHVDVSEFLFVD